MTGLTEERRISWLPGPRSIAAALAVVWLGACQPAPAHTWIVVPPDTIDCGVDDQTGPPGEWTSDAMRCVYDHFQDGTPTYMESRFDDSNGGVGVARLYFDESGTVFRIAIDGSGTVIVNETCVEVTFYVEGGSIGFSASGCEPRLANAETRTR